MNEATSSVEGHELEKEQNIEGDDLDVVQFFYFSIFPSFGLKEPQNNTDSFSVL